MTRRRIDEAEVLLNLRRQLREQEGDKSLAYRDSKGVWTIGVGHNLETVPLSYAVRDMILSDDIEAARADIDRLGAWVVELDSVRYATLVNLRFNMGHSTLTKKNPKVLAALARGDFEAAADELLSGPWKDQVGPTRSRVLSEQLRTGIWQS